MSVKILPIPEIPKELLHAAQQGTLVLFIGAGVSQIAGLPGWEGFANQALDQCAELGKLNYAQKSQLEKLPAKIKLSIAKDLLDGGIDFQNILDVKNHKHPKGKRIYGSLIKLGKKFITTNYDDWLHMPVSELVPQTEGSDTPPSTPPPTKPAKFFEVKDFTPANLNLPKVVMLD